MAARLTALPQVQRLCDDVQIAQSNQLQAAGVVGDHLR